MNQPNVDLFKSVFKGIKDKLTVGRCEACLCSEADVYYVCDTERGDFIFCGYCSNVFLESRFIKEFNKELFVGVANEKAGNTRSSVPDEEEYLEDLKMLYPEFFSVYTEFCGGNFLLDKGCNDDKLVRISDKVSNCESLSDNEIKFFRDRCAFYIDRRFRGMPLVAKEDTNKKGVEVTNMLEELKKRKGDLYNSFSSFYKKRGYLTEAQFSLGSRIVGEKTKE